MGRTSVGGGMKTLDGAGSVNGWISRGAVQSIPDSTPTWPVYDSNSFTPDPARYSQGNASWYTAHTGPFLIVSKPGLYMFEINVDFATTSTAGTRSLIWGAAPVASGSLPAVVADTYMTLTGPEHNWFSGIYPSPDYYVALPAQVPFFVHLQVVQTSGAALNTTDVTIFLTNVLDL